ncbi:restriction endonuclease subunit S [Phascolarctobacterium succinatutens]|uniref:restriction endonuclease subunit S n=1 Tax=Phascolarctobacterium succinatutens TaxID=626940 RepID=UPI0030810B55
MSNLEELIEKLCPDGVEYVKLNTICSIYDGTHSTPNYTDAGVKFASVENINAPYDTKKFIALEDYQKYKIKPQVDDVLMTRIGSIGVCYVIEDNQPLAYYVSLALLRPSSKKINSKYLKYVIESVHGKKELRKRTLVNAVPIKINKDDIGKIKLPVPPLEVQREIVRILDNFTFLTAELAAELAARQKQYEYYRDSLLTFKPNESTILNERTNELELSGAIRWMKLGDIADIGTGNGNTNEGLDTGKYPFFVRSQDIKYKNEYDFDETAIITSGDGVGVGKIFHFVSGKYALHQRAYRVHITSDNVLPKYFFYYFKNSFLTYISKASFHSSVTSIRRPMMINFPVPVPTLEVQQRIVDILDRFETLCNDISSGLPAEIEARQKQYEYYRDKLLTFKELKKEA